MMKVIAFFLKEGNTVIVKGNRPLLLTESHTLWLVERGKVNVFCAAIKSGGVTGARDYLFEVAAGGIIFGLTLQAGREWKKNMAFWPQAYRVPGSYK